MARKKKDAFRPTSEWRNLIAKNEHRDAQESGELYRVQPVDFETFIISPEYLNQGMWGISDAQREFLATASDLDNGIIFYVLYIGKGAGKNWSVGVLFLYVVYKLLCMHDPHAYLNHNSSKALTLLNVAINAQQAERNFFMPLTNMLKSAGPKAFTDFGFNPETDVQKKLVLFPKNIEIISGHSESGGLEGYDILMGMADEVDDSAFYDVDKAITTLRSSASSRFRGKEKVIVISYRRYEGSSGKILEYYTKHRSDDHVFARRYASWEYHPILTREDFDTFFEENPEQSDCIYGSTDSGSFVDSWIKDPKRIKAAMNIERPWILDWPLPYDPDEIGTAKWWEKEAHAEWKNSPLSESQYTKDGITYRLDPYNLPISKYGDPNTYYVLVGDPALGSVINGGDGYGICLGHRTIVYDSKGRKYVRPVLDFTFRFTGRMFDEGQVQMAAIENLIRKLKEERGYNIKVFSFDMWNSSSTTQWISKTYKDVIVYDRHLVEYRDYNMLRDAIFAEAAPSGGRGSKQSGGGIDLPWHPILYEELRNLREEKSKNRVEHTTTSGKDMADTIARLVRLTVYQWPYSDVVGAGTNYTQDDIAARVNLNIATEEEATKYSEEMNSGLYGLGFWKDMQNKPRIRLQDIINVDDL